MSHRSRNLNFPSSTHLRLFKSHFRPCSPGSPSSNCSCCQRHCSSSSYFRHRCLSSHRYRSPRSHHYCNPSSYFRHRCLSSHRYRSPRSHCSSSYRCSRCHRSPRSHHYCNPSSRLPYCSPSSHLPYCSRSNPSTRHHPSMAVHL